MIAIFETLSEVRVLRFVEDEFHADVLLVHVRLLDHREHLVSTVALHALSVHGKQDHAHLKQTALTLGLGLFLIHNIHSVYLLQIWNKCNQDSAVYASYACHYLIWLGRQRCGVFHYHWWAASIKQRLLFPHSGYGSGRFFFISLIQSKKGKAVWKMKYKSGSGSSWHENDLILLTTFIQVWLLNYYVFAAEWKSASLLRVTLLFWRKMQCYLT